MKTSKFLKLFLLLYFLAVGLFSCSSSHEIIETQNSGCPKIYKNGFSKISTDKHKAVIKNDTTIYNELRFECVFTSFYTKKVMFDHFGKWDKTIFLKNNRHPILKWENIDLFSDGNHYTIFANGDESRKMTYASLMVFSQKDKDILATDSTEKNKVVDLFKKWIKNNKSYRRKFYRKYWSMVNKRKKNISQ